ncbi:MAG: hypothetical protein B7Y74_16015, partial [Novosphingobium sp. 35-62-5]
MLLAETVNGAFGVSELILYYRRPALALQVNLVLIATAGLAIPLLTPDYGIVGATIAMLIAALFAAGLRRHWLVGLGVRPPLLHASVPIAAASIAVLIGRQSATMLPPSWPDPLRDAAPALIALALYALFVTAWRKARPGVLSLNQYRIS